MTVKSSFYIPSLDGIRAVSILIVFLSHAGLGKFIPGGLGVSIFFFLSGYLITTLLRIEFDKKQTISLKKFYLRRIIRICPPAYLVIAIATVLTIAGVLKGQINPTGIFAHIFHWSNYYIIAANGEGIPPGTGVFWSLAVEEHFYLIFPIVYILLQRYIPSRFRQMLVLFGVCAIVLVWRCILVYGLHSSEFRTFYATDTRLDSILFGSILGIYGNPILDKIPNSSRLWMFWFGFGLTVLLLSVLHRDPQFRETFRYTIQGLALFPVFIAAILYHDWLIFRVLNLNWVKFVGKISYSLYLVHYTIIIWFGSIGLSPVLSGIFALGLSLLVSTSIYYFVEKPCAGLRHKLAVLA